MSNTHPTIVVDLDGTLVESKWPDLGDWMPGAINAMFAFNRAGYQVLLNSVRLLPIMPDGSPRPAHEVAFEVARVRNKLDSAGLTFVRIWKGPGKPPGAVYIDDKAERYGGRPGSWRAMTEKVLTRLGADTFEFDAFPEDLEDVYA